ncbi:TetR/AcrR family transcriptional regulator [Halobacterium wangiae]|uniref:TetR/AcrR family transcriptional regulator n=1 Tax=Halobacterium wangiae TaxID=2902623 RepID=UPI001E4052C5|nr:TetR/AcrR family transcriptional regulator [Halobacterium wangiae]
MSDERTDTERELMAATGAALAEHGVAGVTTQKIADEWGRAQSLVHYYYDTKEDLIVAYVEALHERMADEYAEMADDPPLDRLEWSLVGGIDYHPDGSEQVNALYDLHGEAPHNERYRAALDDFEDAGRRFLETAIRDGVEEGTFRGVDPEAAATFLLSASDGVLLRTVSLRRADDAPLFRAGAERYVDEVLLTDEAREAWDGFAEGD